MLRIWVRRAMLGIAACVFFTSVEQVAAQALYAASGSNGVAGTLYQLNPANGSTISTIGPLLDATGAPYGITGLAFHPTTGVLYGSTTNASPTGAGSLVTINPATALVTPVGSFGVISTMADITFATDGTMYGWQSASNHVLHSVNIATGVATPIGVGVGAGVFGGGGLAARWPDNTLFSQPDGAQVPQTLRTVNSGTGVSTTIAALSNFPPGFNLAGIVGMDFDNGGTLYGLLSDRGAGISLTHLVQINQTTAAMTDLGLTTAGNLDAMAFQRVVPEPGSLGLIAGGAALLAFRRRRTQLAA